MIFAVLVNLVLLASPPSWVQKNQPCAGQVTTTWPRWLLRKSHLENLKFLCLMVKCIFGASVTGTNLSLSRSLVNQVKGIYCLGSQLTSWGIVLVSLKRSRAEVSSANQQNLYLEISNISGSNAKSMENLVFDPQ